LELYALDKEIRHRGHTNVIVFVAAALRAAGPAFEAEQGNTGGGSGQESSPGGQKTIKGKISKILNRLWKEEWWVGFAELILKNVKRDRAADRSGLEEEMDAIKEMRVAVDDQGSGINVKGTDLARLKKAVRLAVERNQEERANKKKVMVRGLAR
jgi:hypothetical protein